jgi:hypothetical protein
MFPVKVGFARGVLIVESGIGRKLHCGSSSLREMEEDQAAAAMVGDGDGHWMLL